MKSGPLGTRPLARLLAPLLAATAVFALVAVVAFGVTAPTASFDRTPTGSVLPGTEVAFDSTSTDPEQDGDTLAHAWDLDGDGALDDSAETAPAHTYATAGTYTVKLQVTDDDLNASNVAQDTIVVNTPPVANFTESAGPHDTGDSITFTDASSDADGHTWTRAWDTDGDAIEDFNDGGTASVNRTFANNGVYPIRLRVTDQLGGVHTVTKNVTVLNRPPVAGITKSAGPHLTGDTIMFTDDSDDPDGTIAGRAWDTDGNAIVDFNDGTGESVTKSFGNDGTYPIRLRVTDDDGAQGVTTINVVVGNRAPIANIQATPSNPLSSQSFSLSGAGSTDSDLGAGQSLDYDWDLDNDGQYDDATGVTTSHSFAQPGNKTVRLRVTDDDGAPGTTTATIAVQNRLPTAAFTITPPAAQVGQEIDFAAGGSSDPEGTTLSYAWDLDGDSTEDYNDGTGSNASKTFGSGQNGNRPIRLRVTDGHGGVDTQVSFVYVNAPPVNGPITNGTPVQNGDTSFGITATDADSDSFTHAWDIDGDGFDDGTGANPALQLPDDGAHTVRVRTLDTRGGQDIDQKSVTVVNQPPTAGFSQNPNPVIKGHQVTLTSTSVDPDGEIPDANIEWHFDADADPDAIGASVQHIFANDTAVRIEVVDDDGGPTGSAEFTGMVDVAQGLPPTASFNWFPSAPLAGDNVTFTSTATDPDGPFDQTWDLDADNVFGEAGEVGESVSRVFEVAGSYTVALRADDPEFSPVTAFRTVTVGAQPAPAPAAAAPPAAGSTGGGTARPAAPQLMNPFPIVRVRGRLVRGGRTRITLLTVELPKGATVLVRCRGRGCPFTTKSQSARRTRVRISGLSRALRPRVRIELFIQQDGAIGKYTRFTIRRGRAPLRRDMCLMPGSKRPRACPA